MAKDILVDTQAVTDAAPVPVRAARMPQARIHLGHHLSRRKNVARRVAPSGRQSPSVALNVNLTRLA